MQVILFPDPLEAAIGYLRRFGYKPTIMARTTQATGLHVKLTDPGGATVSGYTLEDHHLILDVSHPDSTEASKHARRIASLLRAWPLQEPVVYADPRDACDAPVWNPLDEPRVPAYTLTAHFSLGGEAVEE